MVTTNKKIGAGMLAIIGLIAAGIVSTTPDICESPKAANVSVVSETNKGPMRIIIPDNKCEQLSDIVLTNSGFERLKNNVFVGTVLPKPVPTTDLPTTHEYCEISRWIWEGQTDENRNKLSNLIQYVIIEHCVPYMWSYSGLPEWYVDVVIWQINGELPDSEIEKGVNYLLERNG